LPAAPWRGEGSRQSRGRRVRQGSRRMSVRLDRPVGVLPERHLRRGLHAIPRCGSRVPSSTVGRRVRTSDRRGGSRSTGRAAPRHQGLAHEADPGLLERSELSARPPGATGLGTRLITVRLPTHFIRSGSARRWGRRGDPEQPRRPLALRTPRPQAMCRGMPSRSAGTQRRCSCRRHIRRRRK
jgi:hypothetical protein